MMKHLLACVVVVAACTPLSAQGFPNPQPTDAHKIFADDAGTWDAEIGMYLQGPDKPPVKYKGVETNDVVSGGLYGRSTFKSQMGDREFEGHGLMGYDPRTKEYTGTWVDNFSSIPIMMKGKYDADTKTLTVFSTVVDPASGQEMKQKQVTTYIDAKTKTFEIFLLIEAGDQTIEVKLMDMTAKKRSK